MLQEWQGRLATAEAGIAEEDTKIAALQAELDALNADIESNWNDIYAKAGADKTGNDAFVGEMCPRRP